MGTLDDSALAMNSLLDPSGPLFAGGGVRADAVTTTLDATANTITQNSAPDGGGGVYGSTDVSTTVNDTIVAANTGSSSGQASDLSGTTTVSGSDDLIGTGGSDGLTNGTDGNITDVADPMLGPLTNNGGPTATVAPLPGSPAIGGRVGLVTSLIVTTDQAGGYPTSTSDMVIGALNPTYASVTTPPTAQLHALAVTYGKAATTNPYTFSIVFSDEGYVDSASVATADVTVKSTGGANLAVMIVPPTTQSGNKDGLGNASVDTVTFRITLPPPGSYVVTVSAPSVSDTAGHYLPTGAVGSFSVLPSPPPPPPPPPPVIVSAVRWGTIKMTIGSGKKAKTKSEEALDIQLSGLVSGAGDLGAYQLSSVTTKKVKKKPVTTYKPIKLTAVVPGSSPMTSSVSLVPATKLKLSQMVQLHITAADLTDGLGRLIDGNDDGQPGGNFVATFSQQGEAFARPSVRLRDRAVTRVRLGPYGEAVVGAELALRPNEKSSTLPYTSAAAAAADVERNGRMAVTVAYGYLDRALAIFSRAVQTRTANRFETFWREVLADLDLRPLRRRRARSPGTRRTPSNRRT